MRPAFDALFDIDDAMGTVVMSATQPALAAIKLAWWRERLEELDAGIVPAEPRLAAAAEELLPRGVSGTDLAKLEEGWATLLEEWPDSGLIASRGRNLFLLAARLLGASTSGLSDAGALYATVDIARRRRNVGDLSKAEAHGGARFPNKARPLTCFAALASRDLFRTAHSGWESEGTPGRAWTLLKHRLFGTIPRS